MRRPAYLAGIALASASGLVYQQLLARLFSATMHYHFAFLALSLAMLGSAVGGIAVLRCGAGEWPAERIGGWLAMAGSVAGLAIAASVAAILEGAVEYELDASGMVQLGRAYLAAGVPLAALGFALALALIARAGEASTLYRADLGGAAAGCLLALPLVGALGAIDGLLAAAVLAAASGVAFAVSARRGLIPTLLVALALTALLVGNARQHWIAIRVDRSGEDERELKFSGWNSYSRVTVRPDPQVADQLLLKIDADAASPIFRDAARDERHRERANDLTALPHRLRQPKDVLVIGPGGGSEVVTARQFGPQRIVACELNPLVAAALDEPVVRDFTGGSLYRRPGVELVIDEGRHFARANPAGFDLVQMAMVDTWAATASGAFALAENHLYTVEGVAELLAALRPGGVLAMTRWRVEPPDQLLRLAALTRAGLERSGANTVGSRIYIAAEPATQGRARVIVIASLTALTDAELDALDAAVIAAGLELLHSSRHPAIGALARVLVDGDLDGACAAWPADIAPPTDDRPFFFHTLRTGDWRRSLDHSWEWRKSNAGLLALLVVVAVAGLGAYALALLGLVAAPRGRRGDRAIGLALFAAVGLGFVGVEVALAERMVLLLGHPSYALSVALSGLLGWCAIGSGRATGPDLGSALRRSLRDAAAIALLGAVLLGPLIHLVLAWPRAIRIALAYALLAPFGLAMGRPFPLALRRAGATDCELLPWAWAMNGLAAVAGGALAVALALSCGFAITFAASAASYAAAWACARRRSFR